MSFEKLLDEACAATRLPEMARIQLPSVISDESKKMVMQLSPNELGILLSKVIDEINHGSVMSIDTLIRKYLFSR